MSLPQLSASVHVAVGNYRPDFRAGNPWATRARTANTCTTGIAIDLCIDAGIALSTCAIIAAHPCSATIVIDAQPSTHAPARQMLPSRQSSLLTQLPASSLQSWRRTLGFRAVRSDNPRRIRPQGRCLRPDNLHRHHSLRYRHHSHRSRLHHNRGHLGTAALSHKPVP